MPATIPTKPVAGAVVASTWGGDVHDRTYNPAGVIVTGAAVIGVTGIAVLPIDSRVLGNNAFMDAAGDRIVIPVGFSGLYLVVLSAYAANTLSWVRARVYLNGAAADAGDTTRGQGATQAGLNYTGLFPLSDGDALQVQADADAADNADIKIVRFAVVRVGDALT